MLKYFYKKNLHKYNDKKECRMSDILTYKPAKTTEEMINYLNENKRIFFNDIDKEKAKEILLRYNYINVITPFKHRFARLDNSRQVVKIAGKHIYDRDVEFSEYYSLYKEERSKYQTIYSNIMEFETHFKSILSYYIVNKTVDKIENSVDLYNFVTKIETSIALKNSYTSERKKHMNEHIESLKKDIEKYHDVYCFFDRTSLGPLLTVYIGLDNNKQEDILNELKKFNMNFGIDQVPQFINKVFTLVGIRNCIMHNNSLEILVRFYNPKTKELRHSTDKKSFTNLIAYLSKEK